MDRCIWINLNELFFLPAIRRVRAEIDMPASEAGPQIAARRIGNPEKTITCRGDLFTRRQSVAGKL
jgi:hypothetical protein